MIKLAFSQVRREGEKREGERERVRERGREGTHVRHVCVYKLINLAVL